MNGATDVVLVVSVAFAVVLALALIVERVLEILKVIFDLIDARVDLHDFWTRRAHKLRDRLEGELRIFEYVPPERAANVLRRFREMLLNEQSGYSGKVPVLAGDLVRAVFIRGGLKLVGIALGIGLVFWVEIDLVRLWQGSTAPPTWWTLTLSGLAVGLGSGPLHKIIRAIEKARERREEKARKEAESA